MKTFAESHEVRQRNSPTVACPVCKQLCPLYVKLFYTDGEEIGKPRFSYTEEELDRIFRTLHPSANECADQKPVKPRRAKLRWVCPVCLRCCPLLQKLERLRHTPDEKRQRIVSMHKPVCGSCKRQNCSPRAAVPCARAAAALHKRMADPRRRTTLPPWWHA